jgi:hypothetical protein
VPQAAPNQHRGSTPNLSNEEQAWVVLTVLAGYGLIVNVPHSGAYLAEHERSGSKCMDGYKIRHRAP